MVFIAFVLVNLLEELLKELLWMFLIKTDQTNDQLNRIGYPQPAYRTSDFVFLPSILS